jgi:DNA-binding IclR family transcriptional regulator
MRGDQLARQWRIIRAIEASFNGLTVAEIAQREETGIRTIYRDLDALQAQCHAKAQRSQRRWFGVGLRFLNLKGSFASLREMAGRVHAPQLKEEKKLKREQSLTT